MTQKIAPPSAEAQALPDINATENTTTNPVATRPTPAPRRGSFFLSCTAEAATKRDPHNPPPPPSAGAAGLAC